MCVRRRRKIERINKEVAIKKEDIPCFSCYSQFQDNTFGDEEQRTSGQHQVSLIKVIFEVKFRKIGICNCCVEKEKNFGECKLQWHEFWRVLTPMAGILASVSSNGILCGEQML